jgi:asparagine synthase (glutamine-hydrolysing)
MCGIAGSLWIDGGMGEDRAREVARDMAHSLGHRGPDGSGEWVDARAGVALGHRRLSILDLSEAGSQPMHSASGRYVITYNGEIYNHLQLRHDLEQEGLSPNWKGHSDTETLLACVEAWGVDGSLRRMRGMFAFGLWDRTERSLILARDRMGEKPLYYGQVNGAVMFASELKALSRHPSFVGNINKDATALLLRHNYIPAPHTIFSRFWKLPPASWISISHSGLDTSAVQPYWSLSSVAENGSRDPFQGSVDDAAVKLDHLLRGAIREQLISDVPLGAFLSGGVDSSTIVALMQAESNRPIRSFSIGFKESNYNEAEFAKAVAAHLGTNHTEMYCSERDALDLIPRLPVIFDEPFADSSQLPTILLSQLTREHVTVAMSGDGGDELFGGYNRYVLAPRLWRMVGWMPTRVRQLMGSFMGCLPLDRNAKTLAMMGLTPQLAHKALSVADKLRRATTIDDLYVQLVSEWSDPQAIVKGSREPATLLGHRASWPDLTRPEDRMMAMDALTYLPDDILVKVDRSSMSASLETRAPFLNHDVVEFAWQLPLEMKIKGDLTKALLRKVLYRYVPSKLIERPKQGFGIPLDSWLRGKLRDWAENLLSESRLREQGYLDSFAVRKCWLSHTRGERNYGYRLWSVLMFQSWLESQRRDLPA